MKTRMRGHADGVLITLIYVCISRLSQSTETFKALVES